MSVSREMFKEQLGRIQFIKSLTSGIEVTIAL
jgi:hypothetical protein